MTTSRIIAASFRCISGEKCGVFHYAVNACHTPREAMALVALAAVEARLEQAEARIVVLRDAFGKNPWVMERGAVSRYCFFCYTDEGADHEPACVTLVLASPDAAAERLLAQVRAARGLEDAAYLVSQYFHKLDSASSPPTAVDQKIWVALTVALEAYRAAAKEDRP